jgi:hypothetical protein
MLLLTSSCSCGEKRELVATNRVYVPLSTQTTDAEIKAVSNRILEYIKVNEITFVCSKETNQKQCFDDFKLPLVP